MIYENDQILEFMICGKLLLLKFGLDFVEKFMKLEDFLERFAHLKLLSRPQIVCPSSLII